MAKKPVRPAAPPKFDPDAVRAEVDAFAAKVIAKKVKPYLRHLLDAAQAKTKYALRLGQEMGCCAMYCDSPRVVARGHWRAVEDAALDAVPDEPASRAKEAFPELVEFYRLVLDLDELFTDSMEPTVSPRADDDTRDPADYVEDGPLLPCAGTCGRAFAADDMIPLAGGGGTCQDCYNDSRRART